MAKDRTGEATGEAKVKAPKTSADKVRKPKDKKEKKEKKGKKAKKIEEELAKQPEAESSDESVAEEPIAVPEKAETKQEASEDFIPLESSEEDAKPAKKGLEANGKLQKKAAKEARKKAKKEKEEQKKAKAAARPLFVIDTKGSKTKTENDSDSESDSDSDKDEKPRKGGKQKSMELLVQEAEIKATKGLTRPGRRELILQARQKEKIAKKLGVDSTDPKVEKALQEWIEKRKGMLAKVDERRKERQQKKAARRSHKMKEKSRQKKEKEQAKKAEATAAPS
ncbi:hypothetical protein OQA88_13596 [Cercophora sp. LCS_1]